ncbi:MAG: glycosyltransferase family 39 protein [Bryobacteraceae bacterium]
MEALTILFGAAFTLATATGLGGLVLGKACREYAVRFVTGAALLSLAVFVLCVLRLAYPAAFLAVGAAGLAGLWRERGTLREAAPEPAVEFGRIAKYTFCVIFGAYFLLYLLNAMAPEISPDGSGYHLGLVNRYLHQHGFQVITWNIYANLSQGIEMLFLFAFAFGKHSAAAMVHFTFLIALVWMMVCYGRHGGLFRPAVCAALLVFASPVVGIDATSAYNDVAVAAIAFTLFYCLQLWDRDREPRLLLAIGLVAGFGFAAKYTAWTGVVYALGFVGWKSRRWRDLAVVGASAGALILPWLVKNWLWVANPLAPFLNRYFPNPYVTISFEEDYRKFFTHYELTSLGQIPMQVTTHGMLAGLLGPVFLLAPLALVAVRKPAGRQLLLAAVVFGANYFSNIGTRFLIPPLPFVALALAMVLASVPGLAVAVALIHALISWPALVPRYARAEAWRLAPRIPWKEALRIRPQKYAENYKETRLAGYRLDRLIETETGRDATVFTYRPFPEAYTSRRILVEYESAENQVTGVILRTGNTEAFTEYLPAWRLRFRFPPARLSGIRVVETASGGDLWSIHELRIFDGDKELARRAGWRLTANPDPWNIQAAFDNSLVTFWRTGEAIHPGMYVAVDFGRLEMADSVWIETAPDQWGIRLKLEGRDAGGAWRRLGGDPETSTVAPPLGLRRAAAEEAHRRGVDYLVLFDDETGAADYRLHAASWGLVEVGEVEGARLYKLP